MCTPEFFVLIFMPESWNFVKNQLKITDIVKTCNLVSSVGVRQSFPLLSRLKAFMIAEKEKKSCFTSEAVCP